MFAKEKQQVIETGRLLERYGLVSLTSGNVSARMSRDRVLITPSGMLYETMVPEDIVVLDLNGEAIEGERKPSSDTSGILHIFRERPDIYGVIHTHQPYATALSLLPDFTEFRACVTPMANAVGESVPILPYCPAGSKEMGVETVNALGKGRAVILSQHGVMATGESLKWALYTAVYLEEAAKCYLMARGAYPDRELKKLSDEQIRQMEEVFRHYGQDVR